MSGPESHQPDYPLRQVYFYLTEGCNLRCRHCWVVAEAKHSQASMAMLSLELFQSVLEQARDLGLAGIKLSGGEPLLHPQIHRFLEIVQEQDLPLTFETNAVLCTPEVAAAIAACPNPFVAVSLDGVDAKTHEWVRGVPGCFHATLQGIENLVQAGVKPQVILTVMRRNYDQLTDLLRLARELGAASVKINLVQPTARGEKLHQDGETLTLPELVKLGHWVETELAGPEELPVYFDHPQAFRPLGRMFGQGGDNCATCAIQGVIGVLANGSYALCGIGTSVPELVFGHASRDSLAEVWHNHPVIQQLREGLPRRLTGICSECLMQTSCLGSCIAQNYYRGRSLWAPYWFCQEAEALGLFPASRRRPV